MAINIHFALNSGIVLVLEPTFECEDEYKDDPDDKFTWYVLIRDLFLYVQEGEPSKCKSEFAANFLFRKNFLEFVVQEKPHGDIIGVNGERIKGKYFWVCTNYDIEDDTINLIIPISKIEYFFIKKI